MNNNTNWILAFAIIFGLMLLRPERSKYRVSSYGNDKAIVIDSYTGEAWVTEEWPVDQTTTLKPIVYRWQDNIDPIWTYKPDEIRNDKNATWWVWLKRKFSK